MRLLIILSVITLPGIIVVLCWPSDYMMSKDIGCAKASNGRWKEICAALAESMEWTWMGHAVCSPGWRVEWDGLRHAYCAAHVTAADVPVLKELHTKATDWRLESGTEELISLAKGDAAENSVFNPKNPEYILKGGCH